MRNCGIVAFALAAGIAAAGQAAEGGMSRNDYDAAKQRIREEYLSNQAGCKTLSGNAKYVCLAELMGRDNVARAELDAARTPTRRTRYDVLVVRAEAGFAIARERCDALDRPERSPCAEAARSAKTAALDDAKAALKTAAENDDALERAAESRRAASARASRARGDPRSNPTGMPARGIVQAPL